MTAATGHAHEKEDYMLFPWVSQGWSAEKTAENSN